MIQQVSNAFAASDFVSRYVLAGAVNTGVGLITYWILIYMDVPYYFASAVSLVIGVVFSFNTHRYYVFKSRGLFVNYTCVWTYIYVINVLLLGVLIRHINSYLAAVVLMPLNVLLGIALLKLFVFREDQ